MEENNTEKQEKDRLQFRRRGRYGEETVLRRVPLSVVPLLDFLLEKMARLAKNDPRKTLEKVVDNVMQMVEEEKEQEDKANERAQKALDRYNENNQ